ncbi:MAG: hypothetical protein J1E42_09285, partial [Akkermansiaceae bacterium]|nr:hypothetical protein [Akkermansiaceae bacterium]
GDLTTDGDLDIENGEVGVDGDADIGGSVTVGDSENDTEGSLVVGGDLDISGDLDIENGDVSLGGDDNHIGGSVTVGDAENGTSGSLEADGNLDIDGDLNIENGDVKMEGDNNRVGGDLHLGNEENGTEGNLEIDGSLTVEGDVDLSQGSGSITGDGELHIGEDGSLKMGDNVDLDGPSLTVDGELDMSGVKDPTLGGLGGDGRVNAGEDADITIEGTGGDFSGTLEGSGRISVTGDGTNQSFTDVLAPDFDLAVKNGGHLSLTESTFGSVEAKKDGQLEFRAKGTGPADNGGANVILTGDLIFRNGSTTTLSFNMNADKLWDAQEARMVSVDGTIYIEREAQFVLSSVQTGKEMPAGRKGDLTNILVMESGSISVADEFPEEMSAGIDTQNSRAANSESLKVKLGGLFGLFYENPTLTVQDNEVRMSATYRENAPGNNAGGDTGFLEETTKESGGGSTSQAGAGLLDHADLESDSTLSEVGNALGNMLASGNHAGAAGTMAAVAGSTVTSLGAAQRDATRGELQRLRRLAGVRLPQVSGES